LGIGGGFLKRSRISVRRRSRTQVDSWCKENVLMLSPTEKVNGDDDETGDGGVGKSLSGIS
jgi:hypothetical protein